MQQNRRAPKLFLALAVLLAAGAVFLMARDIPAPVQAVEKPLPASQFIKD